MPVSYASHVSIHRELQRAGPSKPEFTLLHRLMIDTDRRRAWEQSLYSPVNAWHVALPKYALAGAGHMLVLYNVL
jgi:hypothetical protein